MAKMVQSDNPINMTGSNASQKQTYQQNRGDYSQLREPLTEYAAEIPTPSHLAGKYRFVREIGRGSQAKVMLAIRLSDNQRVVIKQLTNPDMEYALFKREGEVLSRLNIDGVAKFYEALEFPDDEYPCAYIVQEYICGKTLNSMLSNGIKIKEDEVYDIAVQTLNILEKLHHHNPPVIHRDIKPSNIILTPKPGGYKVYLIDFGAVTYLQHQGGSTIVGTYGYMAPEQLLGNPEPGSDIYALGATLVYMLGGVSPTDLPVKDFRLMFEQELQHIPDTVVKTLRHMLEPGIQNRLCNCQTLKKCFSNYKYHLYDPDIQGIIYSKDIDVGLFNKELRSVKQYGDAGNIELWSKLSDYTPRQVPQPYAGKIENRSQLEETPQYWIVQLKEYFHNLFTGGVRGFFHGLITALRDFFKCLLGFIVTIIFAFLLLCPFWGQWLIINIYSSKAIIHGRLLNLPRLMLALQLYSQIMTFGQVIAEKCFYYKPNNDLFISGWIGLLFLSFLLYFSSITGIANNYRLTGRIRAYLNKHCFSGQQIDNSVKEELIQNGRKTISKIVNIQYLPMNPQMTSQVIEKNSNEDGLELFQKFSPLTIPETDKIVYYGVPTFKITYVFNPPDDLRPDDIVHTFYTHTDPSEFCEVGDVLPILYMIKNQKTSDETVYSMPFPLVLDDPINLNDVICSSRAVPGNAGD